MSGTRHVTHEGFEGRMFVNGRDLELHDPILITNPARRHEVVGTISAGSVEEADAAIQAAHAAFASWSSLSMEERARMVAEAVEALVPGMEERAVLLTRENGKIRTESYFDVLGAKRCTDYYVGVAEDFALEWELPSSNGRVIVARQPMGVASIIVPWNSPVTLAYLGIAPALIAGNTVVVKPSTFAPLALLDTVCLMARRLPPGVLNVVTGAGNQIGREMVTHPLVRRVMFTGSTEAGRRVLQDAAPTFKRCTMELGGNDPAIVLADADLDLTVPGLIKSVFSNSGQVCYAVKRIYVHRDIFEKFVNRFTEAADELVVGDGLDPKVTMGPLTTESQYTFVNNLLAETKAGGAKVVEVGKRAVSDDEWSNGNFVAPHIVTGVGHRDTVVTCEQFGPVIPIIPFDTEEEAVRFANDTEFGLASSVWTQDEPRGWALARQIQAGSTFINTHLYASGVDMPFGGFKSSGLGRGHGVVALEEQFELHTISSRRP